MNPPKTKGIVTFYSQDNIQAGRNGAKYKEKTMLIYKASAVIDGIISLRMFFFLIFLSDLRMNHRICLFIRNVVEKAVDNVLSSDK